MAGYCGWSKSNNAVAAEHEGKLPLSRAVAVVAREAGCTRKQARAALEAVGPCEWHHTSKKYNPTDYYEVAEAVDRLRFDADPIGGEVEEAEANESHGGWQAAQEWRVSWYSPEAMGEPPARQPFAAKLREEGAARLERAASFRRWESALRRMAEAA